MTILVKFAPLESLGQDEHPKEIPALNEPA